MTRSERLALKEGTVLSTSNTDGRMWKRLWKLNVLPKVRVFWWRVVRQILPDECTLRCRHIQELGRCKVCFVMDEDLMHALVHCSHAKMFWAEAYSWLGVGQPCLHPGTWSRDILCDEKYTDVHRSQMITVMWAIWHSRNIITHDGERLDPVTTIRRIKEDLAILEIPRSCAAVLPGHGWRPPDPGVIKGNTDAEMCMDSDKCAVGRVARSNTGLLGAWSKPPPWCHGSFHWRDTSIKS